LDQADGVGVIDWQRFGQGPLELDAGMFLATTWRYGLDHKPLAVEAARAEEALLAGTPGLLDERVLAWHRAAALLRLASKVYVVERRKENWLDRAHALLTEATRLAERAARPDPVARIEAPALRLNGAALELILRALSTRPATAEELDQIRKLLDERMKRDQDALSQRTQKRIAASGAPGSTTHIRRGTSQAASVHEPCFPVGRARRLVPRLGRSPRRPGAPRASGGGSRSRGVSGVVHP